MRDIKFRGKRVDNGQWVYGYLLVYKDGTNTITTEAERTFTHNINGKPFYSIYSKECEVIPETVGQYTGRKDMNDKEIYEGGRVKNNICFEGFWIGIVTFDEKLACFVINNDSTQQFMYDTDLEVIGNIYENSELVKP